MSVSRGTVDQARLAEERRQGPQNALVTLGVKRHLLPPTIRMLLDDPGREPPIAVVDRPPRREVLLELGVQSGLQGCRVDHSGRDEARPG